MTDAVRLAGIMGAHLRADDGYMRGSVHGIYQAADAILASGYSLRADVIEACARIADTGHLVPPDGGSPSEEEHAVAKHIAAAIRASGKEG
jgi:hypothetical protein